MFNVAVIGCGIVGAAAAYELSKYNLNVAVFEKENDVAAGTTKANSAIIHAGYDPKPGGLMAKLNVEGAKLAKPLFEQLDIPNKQCGALVLAFSQEEVATLKRLQKNGEANGVDDLCILDREAVLSLEPNVSSEAVGALHVASTMIVSPWEYALALAEVAVKNGADLRLECQVNDIEKITGGYRLHTSQGAVEAEYILNAAGLYADQVHNMISPETFAITPSRGEYYLLDKSEGKRVNHVIFQCPTGRGKGVLVAPTVHGNLIVGPESMRIDDPGDLSNTPQGLKYVKTSAQKAIPGIDFAASIRNFAGNRTRAGQRDFIIAKAEGTDGFIDIAGIESPGLSAAPAIAKMAIKLLAECGLTLNEKPHFDNTRKRIRFKELTPDQKAALIKSDSAYGQVVCRCETITEGEVRGALASPIPPRSIDGVKRRCGAGMGRCQGGFCGPRVLELLAAYCNLDPTEILQDGAGTHILTAQTKRGQSCL